MNSTVFAPPALSPLALATRLALASAALLGLTDTARAQSAPTTNPATLEAVVVHAEAMSAPTEQSPAFGAPVSSSATGLDLRLRETPQSISVTSQAQMRAFGLNEVRTLLSGVTGVQVEKVETDRTYFSSRGFDITNFQEDGIGLPFASGLLNGDMDTAIYDRVEVLRGANGLLSSTGNPSATVNFVRKRPTATLQASAGLTLGSWNLRRVDADVAGPLNASGSVRGRLIVADEDKDSYLDRYRAHKQVASGLIEADLGDATVLTVGHAQQKNRPQGLMWGALPLYYSDGSAIDYDGSASSAPAWARWDTNDGRSFAEMLHDLGGGWSAKASFNQRRISSDTAMLYVYGTPERATGAGLFSWPSTYEHEERQTIVDVQARGPFQLGGRRHEAVFGVSTGRNKVDMVSSYDDLGEALTLQQVLDGSFAQPDFDQGVSAFGHRIDKRRTVYSAGKFNLTDSLKLIAGLNATRASSAGVQYGVDHNYRASKTQPFAGLVYDVHPNISVYGSAASIFNPQIELDASGAVLDPVEGRTGEVGLKFESSDKHLNASLAVFRTQQDNTAEYAGFANGISYYRGVDATARGFEAEIAGTVAPGWQLSAGYAQNRIKGESGQNVRTFVPRQTLRLSTTVAIDAVPGLELGASLKWQSAISRDQGGGITSAQDAYTLLDLMARYRFNKHWSLTANLRNTTDQKYLNSLLWDQNYYGEPRSASVTLSWAY
jgi:outer-membrane receptor for ferric coprogen and ferric-rhodotorulic acid